MFKRSFYFLVLILPFFFPQDAVGQNDSTIVAFSFTASDAYLVINENYDNCLPIKSGKRIALEGNVESFRLVSKYYKDSRLIPAFPTNKPRQVIVYQVKIDKLHKNAQQSSYARCFWDDNTFILSESDAKVFVDGKPINQSSFRSSLTDRKHTITSVVEGVKRTQSFYVDDIAYIRNFIRPTKSTIYKRSLVPGFSQITKGDNIKGYLIAGAFTALGANALIYNQKVADRTEYYQQLKFRYAGASDPEIIFELIEESERVYDRISEYETIRNISLIGFSAVYLFNIWDGIQPPDLGFRKQAVDFNPYIDFDKDMIPKVNLNVSF